MNPILFAVIVVSVIGLIGGIVLSVASVLMSVPTDENIEKIREELPGANCGGCGYSGCDGYAEAVAKGEAPGNLCSPGGAETAQKISEILGVDSGEFIPKVARLKCRGGCEETTRTFEYSGVKTCSALSAMFSGNKSCKYGCLGLGDCMAVCKNGAIKVGENGYAEIDEDLCTGCGNCAKVCPKGVIEMVQKDIPAYYVVCNNTDKGAVARKECKTACIGCGICTKQCEFDAVKVENNLASIDPEKCTSCGKCAEKCPQKCIVKA